MSNVYVYNITTTDIYSEEDFGFISSSPSVSEDYQQISGTPTTSENWFVITSTFTQIPFGSIGNISGTAKERSSNKFDASGTIQVSKTLNENVTFTWVGTGTLFEIGNGLERSLSPYVSSGTVRIESGRTLSGSSIVNFSSTEITFDSGQITFSIQNSYVYGALVSFSANPPENTQLFSISGTDIEKEVDSYVGIGTVTIYRIPLVHPEVDYTPHYGIDQNIGIGTTGIQISGGATSKSINSWVGLGTFSALSGAAESTTKVYDDYDFIITEYDDWGLLTETPPYNGFFDFGLVSIPNDGGEIWGPIVGYGSSTLYPFGLFTISGVASTREIAVYGYYGDQKNPGTSGVITLSANLVHPNIDYTPHYGIDQNIGIGTTGIQISGTALEALSAQTPENTQLFSFSGTALEALSAQTPENTQLFTISGLVTQSFVKGPYSGDTPIYTLSGVASTREIAVYGYYGDQKNPGTSGVITLSANLVHPNIDYTPHYGIEKNIGIGTTGIQISGTALEALSAQTPENTQLFTFSGNYSNLQFIANTPENTQLFTISGSLVEKDVDSYSGIGTPTLSGTALEAYSANPPENTQLFSFSRRSTGSSIVNFSSTEITFDSDQITFDNSYVYGALVSFSANPPENTQLFSFSGILVHPNIDYTPHYGIEKNIGIGTIGIQIRRGVGYTPDSEGNLRDARTYSNRYPINDKVPGAGIGTITFDQTRDLAKYSPLTPYTGTGLFDIVTGFSPQQQYPWLPGPGVGKSWSFTRKGYDAFGTAILSGVASTREIAVYGYYGNDRDPGTSGQITVSQQTQSIIIKSTDSYIGLGTYNISQISGTIRRRSYDGLGTLTLSGTALEAYSAQTPENTQLFSFSGTSLEALSAQTPENTQLFSFSGILVERKVNSYNGSGSVTVSGSSITRSIPNYPARGLFRFATHTVDNDYDTCDSQQFTCDNQYSANVKFVANPPENTQLVVISGNGNTSKRISRSYVGIAGTIILSGSATNIKKSNSYIGIGTIFEISSETSKKIRSVEGLGSIGIISGSTKSLTKGPATTSVLYTIFGSAITSQRISRSYAGIGTETITGISFTRKLSKISYSGIGTIVLSGQLVYPSIKFIPSPDGSGGINIVGSSNKSLIKRYHQTSGSLFGFSSGLESYIRNPYSGIGTIYISNQVSAGSTNNPFQIPRTYVVII